VKPFGLEELAARIRALLRRSKTTRAPELALADLTLDPATHEVRRAGKRVSLSPKEYRLLRSLMQSGGAVVSRSELLSGAWGTRARASNEALSVHMRYLRRAVDLPSKRRLIHTVRGVGYRVAA
jgi:DNA-binding response OmpR family regulator